MTGEVDIRVQICEMQTLKEEYKAAMNRCIHDNEFIMDIADALPRNYNNVVSTIFASLGTQLTLTDFQDNLIQEWDQHQQSSSLILMK
ncbi:hypothetical protein FRC02_004316 [Tulasnella sp. 418]|nr:hypothetical protein FRC02_004316 [Tulasnella sp. 418]